MQPSTSVTFSLPDMSNMSDLSIHPFIKTLDDFASKTSGLGYQFGKNNHIEYTGVESSFTTLREKIIQFSFQLVRTSDAQVLSSVAKDTRDILNVIMNGIKNGEKHSE